MNIILHKEQNRIGGNIIEIATEKSKILLDIGLDLDDQNNKELPKIDGLFDSKGYDGVFISHYHTDHMGLAYNLSIDIPVYIGKDSYEIVKASDTYKMRKNTINPAGFLKDNTPIQIGDIILTPFLSDHSAYDSYMILVEAEGKRVLYTGDFRSNGRKTYERLLAALPEGIDVLISEGTTLSRENYLFDTEQEIEEKAVKLFRKTDAPIFVLQSSTNIDRIVTMFRAAKRSGRIFLEDLYMAEITNSIVGNIPNPNRFQEVKTFITRAYDKEHFRYQLFNKYGANKISKAQISKAKFVMCVRSSMLDYIKSLSEKMPFEGGLLIYSFWEGYKEQPEMQEFLEICEGLGLKVIDLHTSGHADGEAVLKLVDKVKPKAIIPVHTENAEWFVENIKTAEILMGANNIELQLFDKVL